MAEVDGCQHCEGKNPMVWMITHLSPPATIQSCEEGIEIALITLLATRLNVDAGWLYGQLEQVLDTAAKEAEALEHPEPEAKPKPRARPKAKAEPKVEVEGDAVQAG